ncbi:hypothetical protein NA56DRAFT_703068 [Hyaloscypha hepaticicola]|uniref:Uncharacterized protein n=1 Tax=Hyaloscypha hepaticicola TaxID=2082293 RepID=A0A2J6Q730_9HELO|nr:hypothetical protein NA56DRAFT_703068 [Hyaloscypha hepaticicola]
MEGNARLRQTRQRRHATRRQPPGEALPDCNFTRPCNRKGSNGWHWATASQRIATQHYATHPRIPPLTPLLHQQQENELARTCPPLSRDWNSELSSSQPSHWGNHRGLELGPNLVPGALAIHPRLQAFFESNLQLLYLRTGLHSGSSAPGLNYRSEALEGRQPLPEDYICTAEAFLVGLQNPKPKTRGQE